MMTTQRVWSVGWLLWMLLGPLAVVAGQADVAWRVIHRERGIAVSTRSDAGALLNFRGEGKVSGSVLHVLAIVLDDERAPEWAKNADEARVVRAIDDRTQIVYSRSHQTWPVHDRDMVMRRSIEVLEPGALFRVRLVCLAGELPELESVVRLRFCDTMFLLRKVDEMTTHVDYQVQVDPGGGSPTWLARLVSKSIPLETLIALRKQVEITSKKYEEVMRKWSGA